MPLAGQATCPPVDTIASDDGSHRGMGGTGVDSGIGRINIHFKRNVMYGGRYGFVRSPGGGEVYLCAQDGIHVRYISTI